MFKSPRRNGRNKGYKIKHVIQISMLLGVSIWLLYQIHHSDDKNSSDTTKISDTLNNDTRKDVFKLGRKVLRPRVKGTNVDDERNNEIDGLGDVEDHESDEHEVVEENERVDGKEDGEEMKERDKEEGNDDKGLEQIGKVQTKESEDGNKRNEQNKVEVSEDIEKKMSPSEDDNDGDNEIVEDEAGNNKQPSVEDNEHISKDQTAERIESAPDSSETNTANYMKSAGNDKDVKAESDLEAQSKNVKSIQNGEQREDEEEKDALTDLEILPESGTGGGNARENAATE